MADSVWTLPPMAQGRPLAAGSGSAPPLPMMQTAHSRDRSGTVGLDTALPANLKRATDSGSLQTDQRPNV
jgi:hypothetical protein